jgi:hypothetical protein
MKIKSLLLFCFILLPSLSNAENVYDCTVKNVLSLSETGIFEKMDSNYGIGKRFIIDRSTGEMKGQLANNEALSKLELLNEGNSIQSFAAISKNGSSRLASYIYVQEFSKNNLKPFFYVDLHLIYSGTCSSL